MLTELTARARRAQEKLRRRGIERETPREIGRETSRESTELQANSESSRDATDRIRVGRAQQQRRAS